MITRCVGVLAGDGSKENGVEFSVEDPDARFRFKPAGRLDRRQKLAPLAMGVGLASVAVAREHTDTESSVCGYLVDTYCLGVKNAVPANIVDLRDLPVFLAAYDTDPPPAPISLPPDLILGAVDYARSLRIV